ncbi:hypothetical protein H0H93_002358 [Arthromyces matolae]|nr:hypothetical protein H0H93_002358 [Arthromyces matolae]
MSPQALCCRSSQILRLCGPKHTRTFFSLPNLSELAPWNSGSEIQKYHERKVLPFGQKELYQLVSDVESYHHFIPFCTGSRIVSRSQSLTKIHDDRVPLPISMEAELTVGFLTFTESYISRVTCRPYESVEAVASTSTPLFKTLTTTWRFHPAARTLEQPNLAPIGQKSTLVTLDLEYAFANPLHASVSSAFFGQVSKLMVKAFEDRCMTVYGSESV